MRSFAVFESLCKNFLLFGPFFLQVYVSFIVTLLCLPSCSCLSPPSKTGVTRQKGVVKLNLQGHLVSVGEGDWMFSVVRFLVSLNFVQSFQCCSSKGSNTIKVWQWTKYIIQPPPNLLYVMRSAPTALSSVVGLQLEQTARGTHKRSPSAYREGGGVHSYHGNRRPYPQSRWWWWGYRGLGVVGAGMAGPGDDYLSRVPVLKQQLLCVFLTKQVARVKLLVNVKHSKEKTIYYFDPISLTEKHSKSCYTYSHIWLEEIFHPQVCVTTLLKDNGSVQNTF